MSDRELVMRWVQGWAHLRGLRVQQVDGWPFVHVRAPSRATEIVCVDPGRRAFEDLAKRIAHDPRAMLTVLARDLAPYVDPPLPDGVRVDRDDELFMTTVLAPSAIPMPGVMTPRWIIDGPKATFCIDDVGRLAAEGTVGVLGSDAIFDVVETAPTHRRRGLGRYVVSVLTTWAVDHGATTGLLAASADGVRLYSALGWETTLSMWSLMGVAQSSRNSIHSG